MNTLKTGILLAAIGGLAVAIGAAFFGVQGAAIGLGIALLFQGFAFFNGHKMALSYAHAQPLAPGALPWLENAARQLSERAGIPTPGLYISPDPQPNAFAAGRNPQTAVVCINEGLIQAMPQEQVVAVLAHEIGHIRNRDTLIMTVAAAAATMISFVAQIGFFLRGGDDDGPNPLVALLMLIFAPISATVIQLAISRTREFGADRAAAELMGTSRPMIGALQSLESLTSRVPSHTAQPATAHMYIASPFKGGGLMKLFMTHPPLEERIERLRADGPGGQIAA